MLIKRNRQNKKWLKNPVSRFYAWVDDDDPTGGGGDPPTDDPPTDDPPTDPPTDDPPTNPPAFDLGSVIDDDLKEKDYFKNILSSENPVKELVNQHHNAQKLIGSKSIPGEDATDEELQAFYEKTRPSSQDDYEFDELNFGDSEDDKKMEELVKSYRGEEFDKSFKEAMYQIGASKHQARALKNIYEKMNIEAIKQQQQKIKEADEKLNKEFDELKARHFAGDEEKAIAYGKNFIKKLGTDKTKDLVDGLSNEALMVIADMGKEFYSRYEKEDKITDPAKITGSENETELTKRLTDLQKNPAYYDTMHNDHKAVRAESEEIAKALAKLRRAE